MIWFFPSFLAEEEKASCFIWIVFFHVRACVRAYVCVCVRVCVCVCVCVCTSVSSSGCHALVYGLGLRHFRVLLNCFLFLFFVFVCVFFWGGGFWLVHNWASGPVYEISVRIAFAQMPLRHIKARSEPSSTSILYVCEQRMLRKVCAYAPIG